jgi:hypothetical protein
VIYNENSSLFLMSTTVFRAQKCRWFRQAGHIAEAREDKLYI